MSTGLRFDAVAQAHLFDPKNPYAIDENVADLMICLAADITGDGVIDADDFFAYLDLFAQGC